MFSRHLAIPEDLMEQAWTDHLTCVGRYNRASPVLMTHEVMATSDTQNAEAGLPKRANEIGPRDPGTPAHAAMVTRWMPTNSKSCSGVEVRPYRTAFFISDAPSRCRTKSSMDWSLAAAA